MLGEAILLSRISHPNIIRVFNAGVLEAGGDTYGFFTMEFVAGGSLDKFWRSYGAQFVPLDTTIDLAKQVCRGIALAHREEPPIIHRDIKPHNILVGYEADGLRARVGDFGLAKKVNPLTLMATAAGTLAFKPPEAFAKQKGDSRAGDVWAIGCTLYLMLTDQLPYDFPDDATWNTLGAFDRPVLPPSEVHPDVDRSLDQIVLRALELKPEDRYPTAGEMLEALERWHPEPIRSVQAAANPLSSEQSKVALGLATPGDGTQGAELVKKAFLAKTDGRLADAADLMEEAFNRSPDLRQKYVRQVRLWRKGISM